MKKTVFFYFIFLAHACSLLSINFGDVANVGGAFLTGGPSAAAGAAMGAATGETPPGYDMGGFDANAGGASGAEAFDPNGFTPMSDVQAAQMRDIANSMPVTAATPGYTGYDASQQPMYPAAGPQGIFDTGYPVQSPIPGSTDFYGATPVNYSLQPQLPQAPYPPVQQFDVMGSPMMPSYATPGMQAPVVYAAPPPQTYVAQPGPAPQAPPPGSSGSQFDAVGGDGGMTALTLGGAGVLGAGGVAATRKSSNPKDQITLPPDQARFASKIPLVAEIDIKWGGIIRTIDAKGVTTLRIKRISKANPLYWTWSADKKAEYNATIVRSKEKLKATQERNSGIISHGFGIGAANYKLSASDVEYGELYDSYDEKGRPYKKIKKPGTLTRLTENQKNAYERRKANSEATQKMLKKNPMLLTANPMHQPQYRTTSRPVFVPYGSAHPTRPSLASTPAHRTYSARFATHPTGRSR